MPGAAGGAAGGGACTAQREEGAAVAKEPPLPTLPCPARLPRRPPLSPEGRGKTGQDICSVGHLICTVGPPVSCCPAGLLLRRDRCPSLLQASSVALDYRVHKTYQELEAEQAAKLALLQQGLLQMRLARRRQRRQQAAAGAGDGGSGSGASDAEEGEDAEEVEGEEEELSWESDSDAADSSRPGRNAGAKEARGEGRGLTAALEAAEALAPAAAVAAAPALGSQQRLPGEPPSWSRTGEEAPPAQAGPPALPEQQLEAPPPQQPAAQLRPPEPHQQPLHGQRLPFEQPGVAAGDGQACSAGESSSSSSSSSPRSSRASGGNGLAWVGRVMGLWRAVCRYAGMAGAACLHRAGAPQPHTVHGPWPPPLRCQNWRMAAAGGWAAWF